MTLTRCHPQRIRLRWEIHFYKGTPVQYGYLLACQSLQKKWVQDLWSLTDSCSKGYTFRYCSATYFKSTQLRVVLLWNRIQDTASVPTIHQTLLKTRKSLVNSQGVAVELLYINQPFSTAFFVQKRQKLAMLNVQANRQPRLVNTVPMPERNDSFLNDWLEKGVYLLWHSSTPGWDTWKWRGIPLLHHLSTVWFSQWDKDVRVLSFLTCKRLCCYLVKSNQYWIWQDLLTVANSFEVSMCRIASRHFYTI